MLFLSHIVVLLRSDLNVHQSHLGLLNKRSSLAAALGVTKFTAMIDKNLLKTVLLKSPYLVAKGSVIAMYWLPTLVAIVFWANVKQTR